REKVSNMEAEMERMTSMMSALMAAHSQSQAPQFTNASAAITSSSLLIRPEGCTWGMPQYSVNEEFRPVISEIPAPVVPQ
ncbi:hypothetical protein A2U01_0091276, partial [Trifolium medium]|nr:hypothetical protein [Trifolium medium]